MIRTVTFVLAVVLLVIPAAAQQPAPTGNVQTGGGEQLTIKGFISTTFFAQDGDWAFGNGQPAEFVLDEFEEDEWFLSGDVRNTRVTLVFNGPEVAGDVQVGGVLEGDFFGGFNGAGAFSDEQPNPRLRLAYVDLKRGDTTVRLGQAWSPLFGNVPVSLSHIAFPLGYGSAGFVGWRFPGLFVYHQIDDSTKLTLAAFRGSWDGPGSTLSGLSAGEASFLPQLEARLDFTAGPGSFYVVGHYDRKDLTGPGAEGPDDELDGTAAEVGWKFQPGRFLIHGNAYWADSIGQQFGHITQFGEIEGWGAWIQLGYDLTDRWSAYLFGGIDDPEDEDVVAERGDAARLENTMWTASLLYDAGPYGLNLEWTNGDTEYEGAGSRSSNQLALSAIYRF